MITEIKQFLNGQFTKSLTCKILSNEGKVHETSYTLTNSAIETRFNLVQNHQDNEIITTLFIYTRPTEKTLEIRDNPTTDWSFLTQITNNKDTKDIINTIKTKFFPNL